MTPELAQALGEVGLKSEDTSQDTAAPKSSESRPDRNNNPLAIPSYESHQAVLKQAGINYALGDTFPSSEGYKKDESGNTLKTLRFNTPEDGLNAAKALIIAKPAVFNAYFRQKGDGLGSGLAAGQKYPQIKTNTDFANASPEIQNDMLQMAAKGEGYTKPLNTDSISTEVRQALAEVGLDKGQPATPAMIPNQSDLIQAATSSTPQASPKNTLGNTLLSWLLTAETIPGTPGGMVSSSINAIEKTPQLISEIMHHPRDVATAIPARALNAGFGNILFPTLNFLNSRLGIPDQHFDQSQTVPISSDIGTTLGALNPEAPINKLFGAIFRGGARMFGNTVAREPLTSDVGQTIAEQGPSLSLKSILNKSQQGINAGQNQINAALEANPEGSITSADILGDVPENPKISALANIGKTSKANAIRRQLDEIAAGGDFSSTEEGGRFSGPEGDAMRKAFGKEGYTKTGDYKANASGDINRLLNKNTKVAMVKAFGEGYKQGLAAQEANINLQKAIQPLVNQPANPIGALAKPKATLLQSLYRPTLPLTTAAFGLNAAGQPGVPGMLLQQLLNLRNQALQNENQ